jgi:putative NIF3 family GTP cyclohydrolase 1 type 2
VWAGHYLSEKPGMIALGEVLEKTFDLATRFIDTPNSL